jgi:hypothetical protein
MARLKENTLLQGMSGTLSTILLKQYSYGTVISKRPDRSKVKLSPLQKKANKKFKEAVAFAKSVLKDEAKKKAYKKKLKSNQTIYHAALADYLKNHK